LRSAGVRSPISIFEYDIGAQAGPRRVETYGSRRARVAHPLLRRVRERNERRDLDAADLVLVLKQADVDLLRQLGVRTDAHVVDPYLEMPVMSAPTARRDDGALLFTGAMWRRENVDSVRWFLDRVWPRVRAAVPQATFTVAGAGPPPDVSAAASDAAGIVVTGEVPDLAPYYERASAFVAPLLTGGGLKFKVPQAMLYGLPVVATTVAAEGVVEVAPPGTFWAVTDDAGEMADAVVSVLRERDRAAAVGRAAAEWCRQHYSFERSSDAVFARYRELTGSA